MSMNSFDARDWLTVGDDRYQIFRLDKIAGSGRLPYSLKVLLENLLRNEDGVLITAEQVSALAAWDPEAEHGTEIGFTPARVLLQRVGRAHRRTGPAAPRFQEVLRQVSGPHSVRYRRHTAWGGDSAAVLQRLVV